MRVSVVHRTAWNISEDWLQVHSRTQLGQDSSVKCNFALVGPGFSRVAHWSRLCPVYACAYAGPSHHFSWWWQLVNLSPLSVERVDPQYSGASRCWHFLVLLVSTCLVTHGLCNFWHTYAHMLEHNLKARATRRPWRPGLSCSQLEDVLTTVDIQETKLFGALFVQAPLPKSEGQMFSMVCSFHSIPVVQVHNSRQGADEHCISSDDTWHFEELQCFPSREGKRSKGTHQMGHFLLEIATNAQPREV